MKESNQFSVEIEAHIAWLILNRPEKRNTMGAAFFEELSEHLDKFDQDKEIRAVVIKAEGKSFTAGTDLEEAASLLSGQAADQREVMRQNIMKAQKGITAIERCGKPVIAGLEFWPTIAQFLATRS